MKLIKYGFLILLTFLAASSFAETQLKYEKQGSGKAVILIPPLACPGSIWDIVVDSLSKDFTCYTIEIPGFSRSTPDEAPGFHNFAERIEQVLVSNGIKKAIVIGHSFGGYLALKYAIEFPEKVEKLIIMDSYPCPQAAFSPDITSDQIALQAQQAKAMLSSLPDAQFYAVQKNNLNFMVSDSSNREMVFNYFQNADRNTLIEANYTMLSADLRKEISAINVPALVLGTWAGLKSMGLTKEAVTQNFKSQYGNMKNVTFEISDTSRHFIMLDDPQWLTEKLKGFLNK